MKHFKGRRYTRDHEWIDLYESYAITGVTSYKLTGIRQINKLVFLPQVGSFIREGEILAAIFSDDYQIMAHMPLDGYLLKIQDQLTGNDLLKDPEKASWIAIITPLDANHSERLLKGSHYSEKYKARKY